MAEFVVGIRSFGYATVEAGSREEAISAAERQGFTMQPNATEYDVLMLDAAPLAQIISLDSRRKEVA